MLNGSSCELHETNMAPVQLFKDIAAIVTSHCIH